MYTSESKNQAGISLIEQIVFILIVGVAVTGVLAVLITTSRASADTLTQKQALAIAEALLEEVQVQPFTYCDPDDTLAATALSAAGCTGGAGGANDESRIPLAPEGESRATFDNVSDYNGLAVNPITDINGTAAVGLDGYSASITVDRQGIGAIPADEALLITVTVTGPYNTQVALQGYRVRYAPNALP